MQVVGDELDQMSEQTVALEHVTQVVAQGSGEQHHHVHLEQQLELHVEGALDNTVPEVRAEYFQMNY